jgi:hypothetical protein
MPTQLTAALTVPTNPPPEGGVLGYLGLSGCIRLPIRVDADRLAAEIRTLPADVWDGDRGPVVFATVASFFLIGHPRGSAETRSSVDRPMLANLPYLREVLREIIPARPSRAKVARQAPKGLLAIHTDDRKFFHPTVRISIQVEADGIQRFYSHGKWYPLRPGELWVLDNLNPHGMKNEGATPRISIITDYQPSDALVRLIGEGDHDLGVTDEAAERALEAMTKEQLRKLRWRGILYGFEKLWRRRGGR